MWSPWLLPRDKLSLPLHLAGAEIHLGSPCEQLWGAGQGRELPRGVALHPTSSLTNTGAQPFPAYRAQRKPQPQPRNKLALHPWLARPYSQTPPQHQHGVFSSPGTVWFYKRIHRTPGPSSALWLQQKPPQLPSGLCCSPAVQVPRGVPLLPAGWRHCRGSLPLSPTDKPGHLYLTAVST